jgi:hypothetical protein
MALTSIGATGTHSLASMQRCWMDIYHDLGDPSYAHIAVPMLFPGQLDVGNLVESLRIVADRHSVLRARYLRTESGGWAYVLDPDVHIVPRIISIGRSADDGDLLGSQIQTFIRERFDVYRAPLFRVAILSGWPAYAAVLLVIHHSVFDAFSSSILTAELRAVYDARRRQIPLELPTLPLQFSDYSHAQANWLNSPKAQSHLEFWNRKLRGARPVTKWPVVFAQAPHSPTIPKISITIERTQRLHRIGKRAGCSPFLILLSAFYLAIQKVAQVRGHVVWVFHSGRRQVETLNLIGCLFDEWPLRVDIADGMSLFDMVRAIRQSYIEALPHTEIPSATIWDVATVTSDAQLSPEIFFNYRPVGICESFSTTDVGGGSEGIIKNLREFRLKHRMESNSQIDKAVGAVLGCHVTEHAGGIECDFECDYQLLSRSLVARLLSQINAEVLGIEAALMGFPERGGGNDVD